MTRIPPDNLRPLRGHFLVETELLLLPNGQLLVHNLTPAMARLLETLDAASMSVRAQPERQHQTRKNERHH